jgi:hypothetical protein
MKRISLALVTLFVLSGCAAADSTSNDMDSVTNQTDESQTESSQSDNQETDEDLGYQEIIERSYQEFLAKGITERVESAGDNYVLTANPDSDFKAGLYNESFDDILDVTKDNLQLFTVVAAKMMLEREETAIEESDNSVSLTHPEFGDFTVYFEDNLITSGESNNGDWSGVFVYEPDPATLARLE